MLSAIASSTRTVHVSGPDQVCFGIEFWIQAALFERTGYSDFQIHYEDRSGLLTVRRNNSIGFRDGQPVGLAGIESAITPTRLEEQRFSWQSVQQWAREAVTGMTFAEWSDE
jgi:hypothetical protein